MGQHLIGMIRCYTQNLRPRGLQAPHLPAFGYSMQLQGLSTQRLAPSRLPKKPLSGLPNISLARSAWNLASSIMRIVPLLQLSSLGGSSSQCCRSCIERVRAVFQQDCLGHIFLMSRRSPFVIKPPPHHKQRRFVLMGRVWRESQSFGERKVVWNGQGVVPTQVGDDIATHSGHVGAVALQAFQSLQILAVS